MCKKYAAPALVWTMCFCTSHWLVDQVWLKLLLSQLLLVMYLDKATDQKVIINHQPWIPFERNPTHRNVSP